jgi:2-hydroxycyclohexanecarboxyl-CoA dehydrogenase
MTKTALVTGAASGIGKASAKRLAADGMAIGVLDLNIEGCQVVVDEIIADGGQAVALQASIADRPQVIAAVEKLRATFGPVTVLVNNAGIAPFVPFEEITDEGWDKVFEINSKGTFIVTQVVLPDMKAANWGRIVNISSSSAQSGSYQQVHYSASKGAVMAMTRSLSQAVGKFGITVNNIPPGVILETTMSEAAVGKGIDLEKMKAVIPVGRTGVPSDIANAVSWLASEGSSYVTGQTIGVNGGRVPS